MFTRARRQGRPSFCVGRNTPQLKVRCRHDPGTGEPAPSRLVPGRQAPTSASRRLRGAVIVALATVVPGLSLFAAIGSRGVPARKRGAEVVQCGCNEESHGALQRRRRRVERSAIKVLARPGECRDCASSLAVGTRAIWDGDSRAVQCLKVAKTLPTDPPPA